MKAPNFIKNYFFSISSCWLILLILLTFSSTLHGQLAFPTATGAGANVSGGRGYPVYKVTSLEDSGPGTFRQALLNCESNGGGNIVFEVSGTILLNGLLYITNLNNVTIAGQTAPEGGIAIGGTGSSDASWSLAPKIMIENMNNVIWRYMRFRQNFISSHDNIIVSGNNFIFDHCSFAAGTDEGPDSTYQVDNFTFQNNLYVACKTGHIIGDSDNEYFTTSASFNRNIFYNSSHRFPNLSVSGRADVINNLAWNYVARISVVQGVINLNHVNNFYDCIYGELDNPNVPNPDLFTLGRRGMLYAWDNGLTGAPSIYTAGNILTETITNPNADNWQYWHWRFSPPSGSGYSANAEDPLPVALKANNMFPLIGQPFTVRTAAQVKDELPNEVGANARLDSNGNVIPDIDSVDAVAINNINSNTKVYYNQGNLTDEWTQYIRDFWATFSTTPIATRNDDTNGDGIPEAWASINMPIGALHSDIADPQIGYTYLELYLNAIDNANEITNIEATEIQVTPDIADITVNETIPLSVTILPINATIQSGTWSSSDTSIATVDSNGNVTGQSPGEAFITFALNNSGLTSSALIRVFPEALQASAGIDQSICEGESITLTVNTNYGTNFLWSTGEITQSIEVAPVVSTTYTVIVTDDNGNTAEDSVDVFVNENPVADAGEDQSICQGENITLSATGGSSYLWSTGETSSTIVVSPANTEQYSVEVFNGTCSDIDFVTVNVEAAPQLMVSEDITIIEGENATLTVTGSDNYSWNTGETSSSISVSPTVTTTYFVSSTNTNGCTTTESILVTVVPPFEAFAGVDQRICAQSGDEVVLTANNGDSYLWSTGATTQSITVSPLSTTNYSVTVTFGQQQDTDSVMVFVDPNPNVTILNGDTAEILEGDFITLSASGANTYQWSNGATQPNIAVSPTVTTIYQVRGYINDCYDEKQITVNVIEQVQAYAGEDITICLNEVAVLTATGGDEYLWSTGETTQSIEVSPDISTQYTVTVFNSMDFDEASVWVNVEIDCDETETVVIDEEPLDFSFTIYPNPAREFLNINITGISNDAYLFFYDVTGKLLLSDTLRDENNFYNFSKQIDVSSMGSGIYFLKLVEDGNPNPEVHKVIIQ